MTFGFGLGFPRVQRVGPSAPPPPVGNITVLNSAGTLYTVPLTVLDSSGTSYTVSNTVLSSGGTAYNV
jgi:hypothetical protein